MFLEKYLSPVYLDIVYNNYDNEYLKLLDEDNFNLFISEISYELDRLSGKLKVIKIEKVLHEMGFPNNFKEIVRLEK